jgi:ubiquinone biosynthesis protein UbiJ
MNLAEDAINRALERESWARDKLAAHAGLTVRLTVGPVDRLIAIGADGRLSTGDATPDLTLTISPLRLPALLGAPERWTELVAAEGDAALAATLAELALTLPWFVEQMLARLLGPIAGQQVADTGRRLLALPGYAATRFGESLARYLADEARVAVGAAEIRAFAADVASTATGVDAIGVRVDALAGIPGRDAPA